MIKKLYEKIENSTFLQTNSSTWKCYFLIAIILSFVFVFVFLFSFFTTDLSEEYNKMDNVMQNNKAEIFKYITLNKDCTVYNLEEGYNVSISKDTISIISNKTPYLIDNITNPKIQYSVDRENNEIVISKTFQKITIASMPLVIIKYSLLGIFCGFFFAFATLLAVGFVYFVVIGTTVKYLYTRESKNITS